MSKQRIVVDIYNEKYALKSDLETKHVEMLADYVDKKMKKIASIQPNLSNTRIAVLVALELADEAINSKKAYDNLVEGIKEEQFLL